MAQHFGSDDTTPDSTPAKAYGHDDPIPVRDMIEALQGLDPDLPVVGFFGDFESGVGFETVITAVGTALTPNGKVAVIGSTVLGL